MMLIHSFNEDKLDIAFLQKAKLNFWQTGGKLRSCVLARYCVLTVGSLCGNDSYQLGTIRYSVSTSTLWDVGSLSATGCRKPRRHEDRFGFSNGLWWRQLAQYGVAQLITADDWWAGIKRGRGDRYITLCDVDVLEMEGHCQINYVWSKSYLYGGRRLRIPKNINHTSYEKYPSDHLEETPAISIKTPRLS